jgi:ribosomal protein S12 methylthiotransferase
VREVEQLVSSGVKEINLVSQDTIAWGQDRKYEDGELADLVERVAEVKGLRWLRLFYLYPETIDERLIDLLANHAVVLPYVDMPLQHAADAMLKRMRRGCGKDRQKRVVARMREKIPNLVFRTAFIVGHPGETDEEFEELCEFVRWAKFERMGVFRYSDEETSHSATLEGKVSAKIAASRNRKLMTLQRKIARDANRALVGKEMNVLVEGRSDEHDLVMQGRHAGQAPDIDGSVYLSGGEATPGEMRRVKITQASDYDLVGELVDEDAAPRKNKRVGLRVVS